MEMDIYNPMEYNCVKSFLFRYHMRILIEKKKNIGLNLRNHLNIWKHLKLEAVFMLPFGYYSSSDNPMFPLVGEMENNFSLKFQSYLTICHIFKKKPENLLKPLFMPMRFAFFCLGHQNLFDNISSYLKMFLLKKHD